jgi:hypothetical protein
MRLLLSSANRQQIHGLSQILTSAGIRSEIHIGRAQKPKTGFSSTWSYGFRTTTIITPPQSSAQASPGANDMSNNGGTIEKTTFLGQRE